MMDAEARMPAKRTVPLFVPSMPPFSQLRSGMEAVAGSGVYANFGPVSRAFEAALAERLGVAPERVVAVANGTLGLAAALMTLAGRAAGLCVMPAWTHAATAAAVRLAGLTPYLMDVEADTWQLAPEHVAERLARLPGPVVAVMPVSPFGGRIDVPGWTDFQGRTGIPVLVDAAAGFDTWGDTALTSVVSFHATKSFAIGEGGAILGPDAALGRRLRATISLGMDASRLAVTPGLNAKLDEFRAGIGLAALSIWPETRGTLADRLFWYDAALAAAGLPLRRPRGLEGVATSTYVVEFEAPVAVPVLDGLAERGVQSRRWWGDGCHRAPAFSDCPREEVPVTDALALRVLGLPLHTALTSDDVHYVVACLTAVLSAQDRGSGE